MGVLPLLLPLGLQVCLHGSLPSVMEPGSREVAGVRSDCLLRRHDHSWYACSRDVQVPTAPTRLPSHRLHQMEAAASRGPGSRRSHSPTAPPWGREEHWITRIAGVPAQANWPSKCQRHPRRCRVRPRWRHLSDSHAQSGPLRPTNKRCNCQRGLWGGESLLTPPQTKPPPWVAQCRTEEGLQREGGDRAADQSVAQEVYQGRRVRSCRVRRVICPPGQHPVPHHHHQHLKEPSLSGEVGQGPPSAIPLGWRQTFAAVDGGRTWSISSGSTTDTASTTLWRRTGQGSRSSSLTTSSSTRRKPWSLRRPVHWTLWPTSRTSFTRPPASTWMASGSSPVGSRRGAIITG